MSSSFEGVSLLGRMAYVIMCAERYALAKKPDADWKAVFEDFWSITGDIMWDNWAYRAIDLLPEYINELDEEEHARLENLYAGMGDAWSHILENLVDMEEIYAYTYIPGVGSESILLAEEVIEILRKEGIEPPDVDSVAFSRFEEASGRGNPFDATKLSLIL